MHGWKSVTVCLGLAAAACTEGPNATGGGGSSSGTAGSSSAPPDAGPPPPVDPVAFETRASLNTARSQHVAVRLDNGKVLVAGGENAQRSPMTSLEEYDPDADTWTAVTGFVIPRAFFTGSLLPDGRVLFAGSGDVQENGIASGHDVTPRTELYDPTTQTVSSGPDMLTARSHHTATVLLDGRVLLAGGAANQTLPSGHAAALAASEIYDPAADTFTATGELHGARYMHRATLLEDGRVLVTGGAGGTSTPSKAETFDPLTGTWTEQPDQPQGSRLRSAITRLGDGRVMVAAGNGQVGFSAAVEIYDPATNTWSRGPSLPEACNAVTLTTLPSGRVLRTGGYTWSSLTGGQDLDAAHLLSADGSTWEPLPALEGKRSGHTATLLANGDVLVVGGSRQAALGVTPLDTVERSVGP